MLGRLRVLGRFLLGGGAVGGGAVSLKKVLDHEDEDSVVPPIDSGALPIDSKRLDIASLATSTDFREPMDLVLHPRWIIPIDKHVRPDAPEFLEHHSIAVRKGRIVGILPRQEAKAQWSPAEEVTLNDHVVMPGLVNCHTHTPMNLFRSWVDGVSLQEWLQEYIWPSEARFVSPEFVRLGTKLAVAEMLSCGVTTFNDMYFFPEESAAVAAQLGIRALIGLPVLEFPSNYAGSAAEYLEKGRQTLEAHRLKPNPLIKYAWAPHAPYTVSDPTWLKIQEYAVEYDTKIHTHLHETPTNIADAQKAYNSRPIERLARLGLLTDRLIAVHMTQVVPSDIVLLQENHVNVVHCPESNLKLASGLSPVNQLVRTGVLVGLGTDSSASNDDLDMLGEIRTASLLDHYLTGESSPSLTRYQLLEMATLTGARVLGLDDEIGSLEPGKAADIISVRIFAHPVFDPLTTITNSGINRVSDVWVAGRRLVRRGAVLNVDRKDLERQADEWGKKLSEARNPAAN